MKITFNGQYYELRWSGDDILRLTEGELMELFTTLSEYLTNKPTSKLSKETKDE